MLPALRPFVAPGCAVFKLPSRKEWVEIAASEAIGFGTSGSPLVGTAAAITVRTLRELLENSAEFYWPQPINGPSDPFLNQHPSALAGLYDRERLLRGRLLYVEQVCFIDQLVETGQVQIDIEPRPGVLKLEPFADPRVEQLRDLGFSRLREVGKYWHDSATIRVSQISKTDQGVRLAVQRASYKDQARSNLILDFRGDGEGPTLRQALLAETPGLLPQLDDRRLANSLGVTILVFYRDDQGRLVPFLVPRTRGTAVMNRGMWSDSASGAAEWPHDEINTQPTFEAYVLDDLFTELKDEIGLERADVPVVLPMAIGREIMRAGKPQIFFIGFTPLSRADLLTRMEAARALARKNPIEPEEVYRMPLARKPPDPGDPRHLHKVYEDMLVDPQCAASLYYALTFLQRLGRHIETMVPGPGQG